MCRRTGIQLFFVGLAAFAMASAAAEIGREVAVPRHLQNGEEYTADLDALLDHGETLFDAVWTGQEGGGRPQSKGVGSPLVDPSEPLVFPRKFNRISAPEANSCSGCHNVPRSGGGGDIVANVFVLGQRFDSATFDHSDPIPTKGAMDENGNPVLLQTVANSRNTLGMFGAGYIEMLARQMTSDLIGIRDSIGPAGAAVLTSKGVHFGTLGRNLDGTWVTDDVEGLPPNSLATAGAADPPNLIIRPFHQAGAVVSLREFTNNAFNHHHGIQSAERFGVGADPDGDGYADELTRADVTAATLWQAALAVPGRVIPRDPAIEFAVLDGERLFAEAGCDACHVSHLPLDDEGWIFTEPNPYNPAGNLRPGEAPELAINLGSEALDLPRLRAVDGIVQVPAYTDLKLHDITSGPADPNREPLNMHAAAGTPEFLAGNGSFLTRKLWGVANEPPYFHHGQYTTLREAIEAHHGDAEDSSLAWQAMQEQQKNALIEFLKTLQVLPEGTAVLVVDERGEPRSWPPGSGDDESDDESGDGAGDGFRTNGRGRSADGEGLLELDRSALRANEQKTTRETRTRR